MDDDAAIGDAEFAGLMAPFAPFETAPELAAAVSGGADSLCLAWLAGRWARARGGSALGLVVDHGLRPGSAAQAAQAARRLVAFGLRTQILCWRGARPARGVQAAARAARHALLARACREAGLLHLLVAHHAGDQAETLAIRRAAGSGASGLAGMAAVVERDGIRVLRPLLAVSPRRTRATLRAAGHGWFEDPSNSDPAFARTVARRMLARRGGAAEALAAEARRRGGRRAALEEAAARLLRRAVRLDPRGAAAVSRARLAEAPPEVALAALARILCCIGGRVHAPRTRSLARLLAALREEAPPSLTLGGCRLVAAGSGGMTVAREAAAIPGLPLAPGGEAHWDGRFDVALRGDPGGARPFRVVRLDDAAWGALRRRGACEPVPPLLRPGLPVLCGLDGPRALPHLSLRRGGREAAFTAVFRPRRPLAGAVFAPAADFW